MLVTIRDSLRALIEGDLSANDTYALLDGLLHRPGAVHRGGAAVHRPYHRSACTGLDEEFGLPQRRPSSCTWPLRQSAHPAQPRDQRATPHPRRGADQPWSTMARPPTTSRRPTRPATRPPNGELGSKPTGRGCSAGMCEQAPGHHRRPAAGRRARRRYGTDRSLVDSTPPGPAHQPGPPRSSRLPGGWRTRTAQRIGYWSHSPGCTRHGICPFPRKTRRSPAGRHPGGTPFPSTFR